MTMMPRSEATYKMHENKAEPLKPKNLTEHQLAELKAKQQDEGLIPTPTMTRDEYEVFLKEKGKKLILYDHNVAISTLIATFIKRNKNLLHLDLSST
jgi:hypothetical protein